MLERAARGCLEHEFDAMVTAPVHKAVINEAGHAFSGHTEFLAGLSGGQPVMLLAAGTLRVALATTHLPLAQVPAAITQEAPGNRCCACCTDLRSRFGIASPRILVAASIPTPAKAVTSGNEEIRVIAPGARSAARRGPALAGPLPADTLFTPERLAGADAVLAMYHDQGLPVLKYAGFGRAVNITLGLPLLRTSVDHGTALDIAGTGRADPGSLVAALEQALELAGRGAVRMTAHRPRKRFGQHFLHDPAVIARIIEAVRPMPGQRLVEIGPGEGALTRPLLERGVALTVIELDRDLAARLAMRPEAGHALTVVQGDALKIELAGARRARRAAAPGRQPSLQRLHAAAVPFHRPGGGNRRHALHAPARGGRAHGRAARLQDLWPAQRDAGRRLSGGGAV
jgi:4-hydroxythreonine-4-phosphate dehydrogenase